MIKRILCPQDFSPYSTAALEFACALGEQHNASIGGLVILDHQGIERSIGPIPAGGLHYADLQIAELEKQTEVKIRELLDQFRANCERAGVRHFESERQGTPAANIVQESVFYDCVTVGLRTFFEYSASAGEDQVFGNADDHPCKSLDEIIQHSVVPTFAVPLGWKPVERRLRVLIIFNGSVASVRSLHEFTNFFTPESAEVTVLTACPDSTQGHFLLDQVDAYLKCHGFEDSRKEWTQANVRDAMVDGFSDQADLIVLGAHSKTLLLDFMVGSVCKDLITRATTPLLIVH